MPIAEYKAFFDQHIKDNKEINNVSWVKSTKPLTDPERLILSNENYFLEQQLLEMVTWGNTGKWFRKQVLDPLIYHSEKVVWCNKEASYDVQALEPSSRKQETYVLQEHFIPVDRSLLFTLKFSFKALYAQLINWAANVSYEPSENNIYLMASSGEPIQEHKVLKIIKEQDGESMLSITRWGALRRR